MYCDVYVLNLLLFETLTYCDVLTLCDVYVFTLVCFASFLFTHYYIN
jgi:hypothetical protein